MKNKKSVKKLVSLLMLIIIATSAIFLVGCGKSEEKKDIKTNVTAKKVVKIAYLPLTHALPVFEVQKILKNNKDVQVELVKFSSWPDVLDALKSGSVDGASILIELAMKANTQGIKIKAVALGHKDGNAIIASNKIESTKDLKGKTFAIPHRLSSHNILLKELLEKNNLKEEDLNIIEMAPPEMPAALANGQIDGYCVAEPFGSKSVVLKTGKVLYQSEDLWEDSLCCGLVLTDDFINENKDTTNKFISKYIEAGNKLTEKEAKNIAIDSLNQDEKTIDLSLEWISYKDLKITKDAYKDLVNKIEKFKVLDSIPKYEDFVYQAE